MVSEKFKINFNFITNIIILGVMIFGGVVWADSNGVWHRAEDVVAGVFGQNEGGGDYTFPNNLTIINDLIVLDEIHAGDLCMEDKCYDSWEKVAKSTQICPDGKAVVGFNETGDVICNWPYARYR